MVQHELRAWIEGEITRCLPLIGALNEQSDRLFKSRALVLIDALDVMNEVDDLQAYSVRIHEMYRGCTGAQQGLHDLLERLGVQHTYKG